MRWGACKGPLDMSLPEWGGGSDGGAANGADLILKGRVVRVRKHWMVERDVGAMV